MKALHLKILPLKPAALLKRRPWCKCFFFVNFAEFSRTPFLQNTSRRLLVIIIKPRKKGLIRLIH